MFPTWESSPEYQQAKKIVDDAAPRVKTVKDDIARITPKLSTYKKATLEKLIKETKASYDVAHKKNQSFSGGKEPEIIFMRAVDAAAKQRIEELNRRHQQEVEAIKVAAKKSTEAAWQFSATGGGKGGGTMQIYANLCEAYQKLIENLEKELKVAAKETEPNGARKV